MKESRPPGVLGLSEVVGVGAQTHDKRFLRPRYKLVAKVSTAQFRGMVAGGELRARGWTPEYRRAGNTIPVVHAVACLALFGSGDAIFLCDLPSRRGFA